MHFAPFAYIYTAVPMQTRPARGRRARAREPATSCHGTRATAAVVYSLGRSEAHDGHAQGGLLMLVGLATPHGQLTRLNLSSASMVCSTTGAQLQNVNEHAARRLFSMIVGQLEAMRDEIGELRAAKEALTERVMRRACERYAWREAAVASKNEEASSRPTDRGIPDRDPNRTGIGIRRRRSPAHGRRPGL